MPSNKEYWAKRAQEIEESHIRDFEKYADHLEKAFSGSRETYIQKMEYYLDRLAKTQGLTPEGAVKELNAKEISAYRMSLGEYMKWAEKGLDAPKEVRKKLEQASIMYHISYYQAMMNEMFFVTSKLWQEVGQDMTRFLGDKYANNFYSYSKDLQDLTGNYQHITGISWRNFRDVLNEPWAPDGKTFSSRIWENNAKLSTKLQEELTNVITGRYGKDKAAEAIASFSNVEAVKDYNVSLGNAKRLVHSEMHRLLDSGQIKAFNEQGVPMYQYSATLDLKTTAFCRHMDGKVFKVEEYEPGVTAPPHGPWCRSTIIPRYDDDDLDSGMRAMRNPKTNKTEFVDADLTYNDWYNKYVDIANETEESRRERIAGGFATELTKKAMEKDQQITEELINIAKSGSGRLISLESRVKGEKSLRRKLKDKSIEKGLSIEEYSEKVTDILRFTNVSKTENFANDFYLIRKELEDKNYKMVEIKNTFHKGFAYKGINTLVKDDDGYIFELQFHTPESLEIKEVNHKLYEKARLPETGAEEEKKLSKIMMENSSSIRQTKEMESIKDLKFIK